jgi:hypothetical protein
MTETIQLAAERDARARQREAAERAARLSELAALLAGANPFLQTALEKASPRPRR